jgi:hypothetical protein
MIDYSYQKAKIIYAFACPARGLVFLLNNSIH